MLRHIMIISSSGLPVFSKSFEATSTLQNESGMAGLIISLLTVGKRHTGKKVSYIEFEKLGLTVMGEEESGLYCAIFMDVAAGYEFGKLLASQILAKFVATYCSNNKKISLSNTQQYEQFTSHLPAAFKSMVNPIIRNLRTQRGVKHVSLVTANGSVLPSTSNSEITLSGHLRVLISHSKDLMNSALDYPQSLRLESETVNVQIIQIEPLAHVVVLCFKNTDPKAIDGSIKETMSMIRKVYGLLTMVQNVESNRKV